MAWWCHIDGLTHWGRVTHICVSKLTIIGSDNGLSPGRRQAIIWTNAGILLIRTLGTNFSEIPGKIHSFSFKKKHLKMSSAKRRLFSLGLNELTHLPLDEMPTISQTTFVKAFSWMKNFEFWLKFLWSLFLRVQLTITQHWFRKWLGAELATSHYLNQCCPILWRIYVALGGDKLTQNRCNSSMLAMESHLSCIQPSIQHHALCVRVPEIEGEWEKGRERERERKRERKLGRENKKKKEIDWLIKIIKNCYPWLLKPS